MSALTSSHSPAASPRALGFHLPSSPRRSSALNARPTPSPNPKQPSEQSVAQTIPRRGAQPETSPAAIPTLPLYADAATQYSPIGSPPTSRRHAVAPTALPPPPATSGGGAQKRKDAARSQSPVTSQMSHSRDASVSVGGVDSIAEPPVRAAGAGAGATAASSSSSSAAAAATASTTATVNRPVTSEAPPSEKPEPVPEPQEARSTHGLSSAPKRSRPEPGESRIMPVKYETCNPKDLGVLISNMLMELIRLNDQIPLRDGRLTRFHSRAPPGISVSDYLQRLIQHATLSPPILLSMVYYIDRLCNMYSAFTINSLTVHRFLITAATVASKGLSDSFWTNPTYARIGGIPVSELATLELEFLQRVQWKIVPQPEVLEEYYRSLVDRTEGFELEGSESDSSSLDESEKAEGEEKEEDDKERDTEMSGEPD